MKLKFVAVAALAAALAAPAFAVTDIDLSTVATGADTLDLSTAEFLAIGATAGDGNVAIINQESSSNMAYIDQSGATNFASIIQTVNDVSLGVIYQVGDNNRATIYQH